MLEPGNTFKCWQGEMHPCVGHGCAYAFLSLGGIDFDFSWLDRALGPRVQL